MINYKAWLFFLFIMCLFGIRVVNANGLPLIGKIIYIDPGHGGSDPGAMYHGIKEKDINLKISKILEMKLESLGATVFLTRYDDYDLAVPNTINRKRSDLSRRSNIINDSNCDLYLSIHLNADVSSNYSGAQVFYDDVNEQNKYLAIIFQETLKDEIKTTRDFKKLGDIYMYKRINVPGLLLECGFLSNPNERYLLSTTEYQKKISKALTNGVLKYFN